MRASLFLVPCVLSLVACKSTPKEVPPAASSSYAATSTGHAVAAVHPRSGSSVSGTADFTQNGIQVKLVIELSGLPPGTHAVHIHENGDCRAADASSAGAHWNPGGAPHGKLDGAPSHLGDIGNLEASNKSGSLTFTTDKWTIGTGQTNDVVGKAVVVHANKDDFTSQPAGNAGGRVACGVIELAR